MTPSPTDPQPASGEPRRDPLPAASTSVPRPEVSVWNIANALTVARVLLVPVYALLLLHDSGQDVRWRWWATAVFVAAMLTDRLDGHLARSRGLVTDFGKLTDPIADKALTGMAFVGLSLLGQVWWWVTITVLIREWAVTALRMVVRRDTVVPAGRGGKVKTAVQATALALYTAPVDGPLGILAIVTMVAAVAITLVTGVDYVIRLRPLLVANRRQAPR